MTSIGRAVFEALDYGLKAQRMVLIQGDSGLGKSEGVKAWCDMHRGEARYVQLSGINGRRAFFGTVAKACGVGSTAGLSPEKIQARVENYLKTTGLMLVIDEGQYLWPQGGRIRRHPELINWIDTACVNEGIPVAIVATDEFTQQRRTVEHLTGWNSEQFRRRLRRIFQLPAKPSKLPDGAKPTKEHLALVAQTKADLAMVAQKLLPYGTRPMIDYVVGYAMASRGFMQAVVDSIDDARLIASEEGRERISAADLKRAIGDWRAPSDAAQKRLFAPAPKRGRRSEQPPPDEPPQEHGIDPADLPPPDGEDTDFADRESAPRLNGEPASPRATRPGLAVV